MISNAIQTVVSAIIPNTFQSIGDENIAKPYCIHEESDTPDYHKAGLSGYSWSVEIGIIHNKPDSAETLAVSVKAAVEALQGTTNDSTIIDLVEYLGTTPGFNQETREYLKMIHFNILTRNR